LPQPALDRLASTCEVLGAEVDDPMPPAELLTRVAGVEVLLPTLSEPVNADVLAAAGPTLRLVANYAVGFHNIDVPACTAAGVFVTNTPGVLTDATADLTWALILAAGRRVGEGDRWLRAGRPWQWAPNMLLGQQITGSVLGIVGFGRIGQAVAARAAGFGMRVIYSSRTSSHASSHTLADPGGGAEQRTLDELLAEADVVSIHPPLNASTRHLIDARALSLMKPTAILVSTAAGGLIDEDALADALQAGTIFAAGLDGYEREPAVNPRLLSLDNVTLLPHLGSATVETRTAMGMLAVANIEAVFAGRRPPALVNAALWPA
jgi:glyoxylate reductase